MLYFKLAREDTRPERGPEAQAAVLPRCCTLPGFSRERGCVDGVAIESLDTGTPVAIRTRNSEYRLVVLDGARHAVLAQGGCLFPDATPICVQGASAGGSVMKSGWIGVGLRLELSLGRRRILTSPVHAITIGDIPPPPRDARSAG